MINLEDYSKRPIASDNFIQVANLINPKDLTTWEYLIDNELYFSPGLTYGSSALFRPVSAPRIKYTKYANYVSSKSTGGFSIEYTIELKASSVEFQHIFHIPREKEALLKVVVPNFPEISKVDVEAYLKKKFGKFSSELI